MMPDLDYDFLCSFDFNKQLKKNFSSENIMNRRESLLYIKDMRLKLTHSYKMDLKYFGL